MKKVIAIDGPSGVGKSSVSQALANRLKWTYLNTGSLYRAITLAWLRAGADPDRLTDSTWLGGICLDVKDEGVVLDGEILTEELRTKGVTQSVSQVAAVPEVRSRLTALKRTIAAEKPCILEGRDIGTVVFPDAFFKVFLTADPKIRAHRRWLQLGGSQSGFTEDEVLQDQLRRDRADSEREIAPLKQAPDAFLMNSDHLTQEEVVAKLAEEAAARLDDLSQST